MGAIITFVLGWLLGVFTPHLLEPIARAIGTAWARMVRGDSRGTHYIVLRETKIERVRSFLKLAPRSN